MVARGQGGSDVVDPDFMAFLSATEPKDCAAIREFNSRFDAILASLTNVRF
jgi:hypothetical protein